MHSSAARQRRALHSKDGSQKKGDSHLPLSHDALPASRRRRRRYGHGGLAHLSRLRTVIWLSASALVIAGLISSILFALDKVLVHHFLSIFPNYQKLAAATSPYQPTIQSAKVAIVSLHEGLKYRGSLGKFLRSNKQSYANLHGYAYADVFHDDVDVGNTEYLANDFKKPRMLLFLMEKHDNLEWLLWLDSDDIITQPYVSIEERVETFVEIHQHDQQEHRHLSLVWENNPMVSNAGVLLVRNSPTGREYLRKTLSEGNKFFHTQGNNTYLDEYLLLQDEHDSTLLQSTVEVSPGRGGWKPGHWILHLSHNHNYLELLLKLQGVGKELNVSPPPLFPPIERPSMDSLSEKRRDRFEAVQGAIRHAWRGYADVCLHGNSSSMHAPLKPKRLLGPHIPCDDLSPLATSGSRGHDWLFHAATLHDSIDTLALAFGTNSPEYKEALNMILSMDLQATALRPTKTFEYSLRIVGGLLGAFSVTGDVRLLSRAKDAADALLQSPFASSPTVLPRMYDILYPPHGGVSGMIYKAYSGIYQWGRDMFTNEHHYNSLAGVGSFSLEFYALSNILGIDMYMQVVDEIFKHVTTHQMPDGTVPNGWNVMTGEPTTNSGGLGSGSDSFVEYLLKVPLFVCGRAAGGDTPFTSCSQDHPAIQQMLALYHKIVKTLRSKNLVKKEDDESIIFPVDGSHYNQLLCFLPGLIALDQHAGDISTFHLAEDMIRGCHDMYEQTPTGLGPEDVRVNQKSKPPLGDTRYLLRPEYVESLFVMYRITGKDEYQEMAWRVFESLERYCKTRWGYTGLKNVYDPDGERIDDMPSYYIAETLKYLLLLFGPDDILSLDLFVFTTEAHPMRRIKGKDRVTAHQYIQAELTEGRFKVHIPLPWPIVGVLLLFIMLISTMAFVLLQKGVFAASKLNSSKGQFHTA